MQDKLDVIKMVSKYSRFFGITFIKSDGSLRKMNCKLGVTKYLKGGKNTVAHKPELLTVYSRNDKNYRNVNILTTIEIRGCKQTFKF
jgi:hypothetical protein